MAHEKRCDKDGMGDIGYIDCWGDGSDDDKGWRCSNDGWWWGLSSRSEAELDSPTYSSVFASPN